MARLDRHLRPLNWQSFINQKDAKRILLRAIQGAKNRNEPLDHVLLYGPSGLGKSTLARLIAGENFKMLFAKSLDPELLRPFLYPGKSRIWKREKKQFRCLFIDELHALDRDSQEFLLRFIEETKEQPNGLTLLGATTKPNKLSAPLRNRFPIPLRVKFYKVEDIATIAGNSAERLGMELGEGADHVLASRSRGTPRLVNHFLRRVRDVATQVSSEQMASILDDLGIDWLGLREDEREYLMTLWLKFDGGPASITTIAGGMVEESGTVKEFYEPYLLRMGLIQITSRGRVLTERGETFIGQFLKSTP